MTCTPSTTSDIYHPEAEIGGNISNERLIYELCVVKVYAIHYDDD